MREASNKVRAPVLIKVLGAGAGGGFPQWNCNGPLSRAAWDRSPAVAARTQASLAVSVDGERWALLNASPDIRQQIIATPALQPRRDGSLRNSPIRAAVLTGADVDQVAGLLTLRERQAFTIYASRRVLDTLAADSIFNVLAPDCVDRLELPLGEAQWLTDHGQDLGLYVRPFTAPGKIALYLEDKAAGAGLGTRDGDTIGLEVGDRSGKRFYYLPTCASLSADLETRLEGAPLIFVDGTLFYDDELIRQGLLDKTGQRMGHISMGGPQGSLAVFASLKVARRVYIHINNSNPVLDRRSPEHRQVVEAGWEIAFDGMEIEL